MVVLVRDMLLRNVSFESIRSINDFSSLNLAWNNKKIKIIWKRNDKRITPFSAKIILWKVGRSFFEAPIHSIFSLNAHMEGCIAGVHHCLAESVLKKLLERKTTSIVIGMERQNMCITGSTYLLMTLCSIL